MPLQLLSGGFFEIGTVACDNSLHFALVKSNNTNSFISWFMFLQKQLLETKEAIERQRKLFKKKQSGNILFPFLALLLN